MKVPKMRPLNEDEALKVLYEERYSYAPGLTRLAIEHAIQSIKDRRALVEVLSGPTGVSLKKIIDAARRHMEGK